MPSPERSITQISYPGVRQLNEDSVLVNDALGIFGVFDGASSLTPYLSPDDKTGAYIASHIAADNFAHPDSTLGDTALRANEAIESAHHDANIDVTSNINRFATTAAVAQITDGSANLLQISDSIALVLYEDGHADVPLGYHDHDLEVMRTWRKLADAGKTGIRALVADDVLRLREQANVIHGFLNGDANVANFILTKTVSLDHVSSILLLTDGMFIPKTNPDAAEDWQRYAQLYREGGLEKIYATVRDIENSDTELTIYPRYKLHDDASAVAIDFK